MFSNLFRNHRALRSVVVGVVGTVLLNGCVFTSSCDLANIPHSGSGGRTAYAIVSMDAEPVPAGGFGNLWRVDSVRYTLMDINYKTSTWWWFSSWLQVFGGAVLTFLSSAVDPLTAGEAIAGFVVQMEQFKKSHPDMSWSTEDKQSLLLADLAYSDASGKHTVWRYEGRDRDGNNDMHKTHTLKQYKVVANLPVLLPANGKARLAYTYWPDQRGYYNGDTKDGRNFKCVDSIWLPQY